MTKNETVFLKDMENKKLKVERSFDAPLEKVWSAWTTSELLDLWWAPKPYKANTITMNFEVGSSWQYLMVGPKGDKTWCKVAYTAIDPHKSFANAVMFCDEAGNENLDMPKMYWTIEFNQTGSTTIVAVLITFDKTADMEWILKMGFQEGFTAGLDNLDEYLGNN